MVGKTALTHFSKKANVNSEVQKPTNVCINFFDTVNHLSGPLKKEKFTSVNEFKGHGL